MRHAIFILFGMMLLAVGCAAVEPARVENGQYIHPGNQFSLRVPAGWEVSEGLPPSLKKNMSFVSRRNFKATLSNPQGRCFILVSAEKTDADWMSFKMYTDKFVSSLRDYFSREKKKFSRDKKILYYRYDVYEDRIEKCDGSCIASKIDFQAGDLKATGHNLLYKSRRGMLYSVSLILIAREDRYSAGQDVLRDVVESFRVL